MPSIIKKSDVRMEPSAALPGAAAAAPRPAGRSRKGVQLLRAEGRVLAIQVTCACGETTLVELEYESEESR